jgi:hypothetical protein
MTDEIHNLVTLIKQSTDYQTNKRILREKIQTDLHFAYNGGLFKADPAIYSFVILWKGDPDALFLEDVYHNPIKINQQEFVELCTQHYQTQMNEWHIQHEEIRRARKI